MNGERKRLRIEVFGRVQGVGFRPTVYRYASERGLAGYVLNNSRGVLLEVEGDNATVEDFVCVLKKYPPRLSRVRDFIITPVSLRDEQGFHILPSIKDNQLSAKAETGYDIATCEDCLKELFSPDNRRYLFPFINCIHCGPRFTIIKKLPYDRKNTTMSSFSMCRECREEYENVSDRRFHTQPVCCFECGPVLELVNAPSLRTCSGRIYPDIRAINRTATTIAEKGNSYVFKDRQSLRGNTKALKKSAELLEQGNIIAVKGLGGFHLACDAKNEDCLMRLRKRKRRVSKPFAVMARNISTAEKYCEISEEEKNLLLSGKAPVVLLKKRNKILPEGIAPGNNFLGVMLPYTPIHHLLFHFGKNIEFLVMTSGNVSEEPLAYENETAFIKLSNIADYFLIHDRDIFINCDDSVSRIFVPEKKEYVIRRSRGYVLSPLRVNQKFKLPVFAAGSDLKNTFAIGKENEIFVSQHIGDLAAAEAFRLFGRSVEHFKSLLGVRPQVVAYDLHPEYFSAGYAKELLFRDSSLIGVPVQHHHAHIASVMADNGLSDRKVIGVALDGTGYGSDGSIWGGEFLIAGYSCFERAAHLKNVPLPGGEKAIREVWRMGCVYLYDAFGKDFLNLDVDFVRKLNTSKWEILERMLNRKVNCPPTSSMGRLFDAVASVLGICEEAFYEGQAAVELESLVDKNVRVLPYPYELAAKRMPYVIDSAPVIKAMVRDIEKGVSPGEIASKFHSTVTAIITDVCKTIKQERDISEVALSGGVFQNMVLLENVFCSLKKEGFRVYIHNRIPANDGGISVGQAVIANYRKAGN